jgi:Heparinase II/III-like protein
MSKTEEGNLRESVPKDSIWNSFHEIVIKECNKMLETSPVEYELEGFRLLQKSQTCKRRVMYLSYAWRITGDRKYLDRVEKELVKVSSFVNWNPSHFLDAAEMTMAVAIGYDWLYDDLQRSTIDLMKRAIIEKGLEPSFESKNEEWLNSPSNWNQVCNSGLTYGALAVYDEAPELARKIINRAIESIQLPMKAYDPDGAYEEGYEYWRYGTTYNVYFIDAIERNFGTDFGLLQNSGFLKTPSYLLNIVGPNALNFNYGDSESNCWLNPAMFWFANKKKDNSLLYSEKVIAAEKKRVGGIRDLPTVLIWGAGVDFQKIAKPQSLIWVGQGTASIALMRSSWDREAIFIGLKGGSASNLHAHMDVGSFVLDAMGERWAMDFGAQKYNSLESKGIKIWSSKQESQRWQVFRYGILAHNTLSFNNGNQLVKGRASVTKSTAEEKFLSGIVDLTEVYSNQVRSAKRGVAIVDGQYAVIRDEIELSHLPATVRWTMVTPATVKILDRNTAELSQNNKKMILKVQEPSSISLTTWTTDPPEEFDAPNPGTIRVGFEIQIEGGAQVNLTVLLIPDVPRKAAEVKQVKPLHDW